MQECLNVCLSQTSLYYPTINPGWPWHHGLKFGRNSEIWEMETFWEGGAICVSGPPSPLAKAAVQRHLNHPCCPSHRPMEYLQVLQSVFNIWNFSKLPPLSFSGSQSWRLASQSSCCQWAVTTWQSWRATRPTWHTPGLLWSLLGKTNAIVSFPSFRTSMVFFVLSRSVIFMLA